MEDGASMLSTPTVKPTMKETDPHGPVAIDPEVVLAARPDRVAPPPGTSDAARRSAERQAAERQAYAADAPGLAVDTTFRATDVHALPDTGQRSSIATWAVRTVVAVLFAVCSAVAAAAWQSYGDQAQELVARWMPRISLTSTSADKTDGATPPVTQAAAEDQPAPAAAMPAPASDGATSAPQAGTAPNSTQLLQSMAHDLAAMGQQIGELKASLAQLKAGQEQMARDMGRVAEAKGSERTLEAKPFDPKAIEQTLRPRPAAAAVRPAAPAAVAAAAPVHRTRSVTYAPTQTIAAPPAPMPLQSAPAAQTTADPGADSVVRPPMPVR